MENNVRLPGGKYVCRVQAWTWYTDGHGQCIANNGVELADVLLDHLTPSAAIPLVAPDDTPPSTPSPTSGKKITQPPHEKWLAALDTPITEGSTFYVDLKPIWKAWFNLHHPIEDIMPVNRRGKGQLRDEQVPSAHVYKENVVVDFGTEEKHSNDALEVAMLVWGKTKSQIGSETCRELNKRAMAALNAHKIDGTPLPEWVRKRLTPIGHAYLHGTDIDVEIQRSNDQC